MLIIALVPGAVRADGCPPPPPVVKDLDLPRFYGDAAGSVVDPRLEAAHKAAVEPLTAFLRRVTSDADKAWRRSRPEQRLEAAHCALTWLAAWAKGEALLGRMATAQAEYQRKWDLAGAALAYLKVRQAAGAAERALIEAWLVRLADRAHAFFDDPGRKRNNHWYWLGLAAGATGLAADSPRHWQMARGIFRDAMRDVAADGTLAHELERRGRALHYHAFAATPLVVLAELARSRGEDWYALGDGALHRLVEATLAGLEMPERFARLAGAEQERATRPGAGWTELYAKRFPERLKGPVAGAQDGHRWLGGSVAVLAEALVGLR